jgi:beta-xylosidase
LRFPIVFCICLALFVALLGHAPLRDGVPITGPAAAVGAVFGQLGSAQTNGQASPDSRGAQTSDQGSPGSRIERRDAQPQNGSTRSGNPILPGWYADPEAHVFQNEYWIYPTYSAPYDQQVFMDAFSSRDLITWKKHPRVLDIADVQWARRALWAPSVVEKGGWYFLFFGANDIQNDTQLGGIGVARAREPAGPFKDFLGKPLIDKFHNGAQPIDPFVFRDRDGSYYITYGGWRHCNITKLNSDFTGLIPFADGETFKEITPTGYVEGSFMFEKDGKYYFMWSEGGWTGPDYAVAYAIGSSPFGPFERIGKILQQDPRVATGAGHHSVLHRPGANRWYIVYHRRPLGETDRNHRVVCIDEMSFDGKGFIKPVVITREGVRRDVLR